MIGEGDIDQASALGHRIDAAPSANSESEQKQAREKMGALIDKLDASVGEKGVIAVTVGVKDETGDHRAAILNKPVIGEGQKYMGYVVLTPDGPMVLEAENRFNNNNAVHDIMRAGISPEDYAQSQGYLKGFKYFGEPIQGWSPRRMSYRLENPDQGIIHLKPHSESTLSGTSVEEIFDQSVTEAAKPLASSRNQAAESIELADSLSSKF